MFKCVREFMLYSTLCLSKHTDLDLLPPRVIHAYFKRSGTTRLPTSALLLTPDARYSAVLTRDTPQEAH